MYMLYIYMFVFSFMSIMIIRKHIFLCLISLEFIVISLLMYISYYLMFFDGEFYLMILFMVMFVCEGVLGLSVLVSMIRYFGNDNINSFSMW
nr:NADH dehydrogenase subunit 4L [Paradorydium reflexanum]